jgi:subtilisin family serine protease
LSAAALLSAVPWDLVRVDDPSWPGAIARSATGATLLSPPPPGTPWRWEAVPVDDPIDAPPLTTGRIWPATDALSVTNADSWHAQGITGQGVKVAVFDLGWYGGETDLSELGPVTTHDCQLSSSCEPPLDLQAPTFLFEEVHHGVACAETVHDLAPDADLHLVRVNSLTTFENAVEWAIREHVQVISMSMSFYDESFYDGTGPFAPYVEALEANGILLVSSAGNNASTHWSGRWVDGDGDDRLDGPESDNAFLAYDLGDSPSFSLNWNQHEDCGQTDLDLYVYDLAGDLVGSSTDAQQSGADRCEPVERLVAAPTEDGYYRLEVVRKAGSVAGLQYDLLPRDMAVVDGDTAGSIADPGSNRYTFAVGAVNANRYLENPAESFSSEGPSHSGLPKPDIAGPDGISTSEYGPAGFFGTSASTPVVAGLVALVLSSDPSLSPREAAEHLQAWAWSDDPFASDPELGAGKARLPILDPGSQPCGRRPLILPVFVWPAWWWRRRRRWLG